MNFRTIDPATHVRVKLHTSGKTRTQQHFEKECNINNIMAKYQQAPGLGVPQRAPGEYLDVSAGLDLQQAMALVQDATEAFYELPSSIRKEFDNNPVALVNFVRDDNNRERAIELGLVPPDPALAEPDPSPTPDPE